MSHTVIAATWLPEGFFSDSHPPDASSLLRLTFSEGSADHPPVPGNARYFRHDSQGTDLIFLSAELSIGESPEEVSISIAEESPGDAHHDTHVHVQATKGRFRIRAVGAGLPLNELERVVRSVSITHTE